MIQCREDGVGKQAVIAVNALSKICHGSHGADKKPKRPQLNGMSATKRDSS